MNEEIIRRHNEVVDVSDTVYILGDLMMGPDIKSGMGLLKSMNGSKVIIRGNHDTSRKVECYYADGKPIYDAFRLKYRDYSFFLCHYPTLTANFDQCLKTCTINLFGHTHEKSHFYNEIPWMYNVGVDAHDCYPVLLDDILKEIKDKVRECETFL